MSVLRRDPADVLADLAALRAADAPTHGGRVLSYVYDSGEHALDELAGEAARLVQPVNGLDPTTFTSVAAMESAVVGFARRVFHGEAGGAEGLELGDDLGGVAPEHAHSATARSAASAWMSCLLSG